MGVRKAKPPPKPVLLIAEAAEALGVSQVTLRRWDASGRFPARRHPINGYRLFEAEAVRRLRDQILAGEREAS
jgi:MerR family transcriptional regulator, copper efflux regulator